MALSSNASILAMGAPYFNNNMGYVKVYCADDNGRNRVQLGQTIYGDATNDYFGNSADITANRMTISCGSPGSLEANNQPGYVRVFSLVGGDGNLDRDTSWEQIGQDIIGEANSDQFGISVSISNDGNTIAVGANFNNGDNGVGFGHVRIYHLEEDKGTRWEQIDQDIDGKAAFDFSGWSVSLLADGMTVAISSPYNDENGDVSSQVRVYQIDGQGLSWEQLGQVIFGNNAFDLSGWSVNLSPDGNALAIGSPGHWEDDDRLGYVRVFSLEVDIIFGTISWEQIGRDIIGDANGNEFGYSVSLSDDGRTLVVGARAANGNNGLNLGQVRVYQTDANSKSGCMQLGNDINGVAAYD